MRSFCPRERNPRLCARVALVHEMPPSRPKCRTRRHMHMHGWCYLRLTDVMQGTLRLLLRARVWWARGVTVLLLGLYSSSPVVNISLALDWVALVKCDVGLVGAR